MGGFAAHDGLVDGAHGGCSAAPQDCQNFEFGIGGARRIERLDQHLRRLYYEEYRGVKKKLLADLCCQEIDQRFAFFRVEFAVVVLIEQRDGASQHGALAAA